MGGISYESAACGTCKARPLHPTPTCLVGLQHARPKGPVYEAPKGHELVAEERSDVVLVAVGKHQVAVHGAEEELHRGGEPSQSLSQSPSQSLNQYYRSGAQVGLSV